MTSAECLPGDEWHLIEKLLPPGWKERARDEKAFRRARYVDSPAPILRLLLFHAAAGRGLRETVARARAAGLPSMSSVGLHKRLRTCGGWLRWIASELCQPLHDRPLIPDGLRPRAIDATTVQGPGNTTSEWRLHYTLDLQSLSCDWHELTDAKRPELLERPPVLPGDVLIGDRAYLRAAGVAAVVAAGAHVLTRMRWKHPEMVTANGRPCNALALAKRLRLGHVGDWAVTLNFDDVSIPGRIVAIRLPASVAERSIRKLRRNASKKQTELDARSIEAAKYVMLFTTLPKELLSAKKVAELYRYRWQIEVAFRRHKQLLKLGQLPHTDAEAAQSWILAKLILALLLEKLYRTASSISPWGYRVEEEVRLGA